jgi:hypothetical protein
MDVQQEQLDMHYNALKEEKKLQIIDQIYKRGNK